MMSFNTILKHIGGMVNVANLQWFKLRTFVMDRVYLEVFTKIFQAKFFNRKNNNSFLQVLATEALMSFFKQIINRAFGKIIIS